MTMSIVLLIFGVVLTVTGGGRPALAAGTEYLFWAVANDGASSVWRAHSDGSSATRITGGFDIRCVVADLDGGKLYWSVDFIDNSPGYIVRADLDGSSQEILIGGLGAPWDLELDLASGKIYWTDYDAGTVCRANLDGTNVEELVTGQSDPMGLALDLEAGTLYFTERFDDSVSRANIDGSGVSTIITGYFRAGDVEVDTTNNKLYVSSSGSSPPGISWADLDGSNLVMLADVLGSGVEVRGDKVYYLAGTQAYSMDLDGGNQTALTPADTVSRSLFHDVDVTNGQVYAAGDYPSAHLFRFDLDPVTTNPLLVAYRIGPQLHDVAVDGGAGRIYFADAFDYGLFTGDADWSSSALLFDSMSSLAEARGMVVDAAAGVLYWVELDNYSMWSANTDGTGLTELVAGLDSPHDLALDAINGHLYFTDGIDGGTPSIRRVDTNGGNLTDILTGLSSGIRGIAVDSAGGRMYWTDHSADTISRADLDGSNEEVILWGLVNPHDVAVDAAGGKLYWTEGISGSNNSTGMIRRADLDGSNPEGVLTGLSALIRDLEFVTMEVPLSEVFADGFELGDTSMWSETVE